METTYTKPEFNPKHPWPRACERYARRDVPKIAKQFAELKIGRDCKLSFVLGFLFAQEVAASEFAKELNGPDKT